MKIIDFEKKGNLVRFWLGNDECADYYGDDWNDTPYEHNAGKVYDEFISGYVDVFFPFDYTVMEPSDDWHYSRNSPYCKDDMRDRICPCIVAVKDRVNDWIDPKSFAFYAASDADGVIRYYFNDKIEVPESRMVIIGT